MCHRCNDGKPMSHINMEVWKSPAYTFNDKDQQYCIDCGPLGPKVRKGIFVKTKEAFVMFHEKKVPCIFPISFNFFDLRK